MTRVPKPKARKRKLPVATRAARLKVKRVQIPKALRPTVAIRAARLMVKRVPKPKAPRLPVAIRAARLKAKRVPNPKITTRVEKKGTVNTTWLKSLCLVTFNQSSSLTRVAVLAKSQPLLLELS